MFNPDRTYSLFYKNSFDTNFLQDFRFHYAGCLAQNVLTVYIQTAWLNNMIKKKWSVARIELTRLSIIISIWETEVSACLSVTYWRDIRRTADVMIREGAISRNSSGIYIMQNRFDQVARSFSNAVTRVSYVPEYVGLAATAFLCRLVAETSTVAWRYPTSNSTTLEPTFAKPWVIHHPPRAVKWTLFLTSRSVSSFLLFLRFQL